MLALIFLLENLGFIVHHKKAVTTISGHGCTHPLVGALPNGGEDKEIARRGKQDSESLNPALSERSFESAGEDECSFTGSSPSTALCQTDPERPYKSVGEEWSEL